MNRLTSQPYEYASIDDLRRGLLVQIRRFNRACAELSASGDRTISLDGGDSKRRPVRSTNDLVFNQLQLLRDQVTLLKNMIGVLQAKFATEPKAKELIPQVNELIADIVEKANRDQRAAHKDARGKVNRTTVIATQGLARSLTEDFHLKPDQVATNFLIGNVVPLGGSVTSVTAEVGYVRLTKLKDDDGYEHESFFVVLAFPAGYNLVGSEGEDLTHMIRKTGGGPLSKIYIAVLDNFKVPGKIRWDTSAKNASDMRKLVRNLLVDRGIIGSGVKRELPIPKEHVNFSHENIKSTTVKGDMIEVHVRDRSTIDSTAASILNQLKGIVKASNPKNRDLISTKIVRDIGVIRFIFTLPASLKGRYMTPKQLAQLKNVLNLDDHDLKRIQTALEDHEQD